ncbi:MAG TPA: plastocyanin/azurin family copper-binding protein [Actinomycetota bacterium]|nr:plastocyanin/azurin family copper-binding protein [Actinomycetota bacterium]
MRRSLVFLVAAAFLVAPAAPAQAAVALTGPGGFAAGYLTPVVVAMQGEAITYVNGDIAPHNFVALDDFLPHKLAKKTDWCSAYDKGKCPLFWSDKIGAGQMTDVLGVENLEAGGQYAFFCTVHPNMKGTLIIQ